VITRSYDAVIVHPSPGAFTAAAMLAASGKQVLVVEEADASPQGKYRFPSHRRVLAGIGGGIFLPGALREVQVHPKDIQSLKRSEPLFQVVDPDHRLDVPTDPDRYRGELAREYGQRAATAAINLLSRMEEAATAHAETIQTSLSEETGAGFWSKLGMKKASWAEPREPGDAAVTLGAAAEEEEVPADALRALAAPLHLLAGVADPLTGLSVARAGILLMEAHDGLYQDPAAPDAFHALMRGRVEGIKVDITSDDQPEEFVFGWGRLKEIRFAGRKQPVRAESLITGADPALLTRWMSGSVADEYSAASLELVPTHFLHTIRLGIADEVIPEGMCDHVFLIGREGPIEGPDGMLLSMTPARSAGAPEGRRAMAVSCRLPLSLVDGSNQGADALPGALHRGDPSAPDRPGEQHQPLPRRSAAGGVRHRRDTPAHGGIEPSPQERVLLRPRRGPGPGPGRRGDGRDGDRSARRRGDPQGSLNPVLRGSS
jgi:hypothetical protein